MPSKNHESLSQISEQQGRQGKGIRNGIVVKKGGNFTKILHILYKATERLLDDPNIDNNLSEGHSKTT